MAVIKVSRRDFFRISSTATAGLVLAVSAPVAFGQKKRAYELGPLIEIGTDGIVTVWVTKSDMGQGVRTALPMIVAEEMGADWNRVRIRQAHYDRKFGSQGTGGSGSIRSMWTPLRQAGAAARTMLVAAAAAKLGVDASTLSVSNGVVSHPPSKRKLTFAQLAEPASKLEVPKDVKLKDPSEFTIIGKKVDRVDNRDIVTGKAVYGIDVSVPGMLHASVLRSPAFGGKVASLDDTKARAVPGVRRVVRLEPIGTDLPWTGIGVIADSTYAAMKGREALEVVWDAGEAASESSQSLRAKLAEAVKTAARSIHDAGNVERALRTPEKTVEATYELPYLAHATMEPLNAVASVTADGAELWTGTQFPGWVNSSVADALKLKPEQVKVNVTMLGGGFGRRANPDFALEAALLSKAAGAPVKVTWTREDDMQHDYYRPASHHHVRAGLDKEGKVVAWHHRFAAPSISGYFEPGSRKPWDSEAGGIEDLPFAIPNIGVDFALEAALLSKAAGAPVKVTWTREDDMQHDYYRPASHHHVRAGLDKEG
ncbi:MAG TPA: molybdopterin cofactor-binding domain-containing protein, partial [Thermoanaerobaculia bacterium]|nr:molybdopterin cofactor-binding domain-containing protein [Thermoanaerobaculia bacterium]